MKALIALLLFFLASLGTVAYLIHDRETATRQQRQNSKAPEEKITFIEGWTLEEMAAELEHKGTVSSADFMSAVRDFQTSDYPLLKSKPEGAELEGFLFPDTYRILKLDPRNPRATSMEIITKALNNFSVKFTSKMEEAAAARGMSVFEIVTLASIIERETGRNAQTSREKLALQEERNLVAGVFYNRLKAGVPLQSDATVNFVTKKNTPSPSERDLQVNSPYNTYLIKGLPPGPICNPSLSSLMAAVFPSETEYFYFLHKQPSGEPVFSKTFEEHVRNKQKYLK